MPKILLVEGQQSIREKLGFQLIHEDFEIVGMANNGAVAIKQAEIFKPDIILLDIQISEIEGFGAAKIINERFPRTQIIILSSTQGKERKLKEVEIAGVLSKNSSKEHIIRTITNIDKSRKLALFQFLDFSRYSRLSLLLLFFPLTICSLLLLNSIHQTQPQNSLATLNTNTKVTNTQTQVMALGTIVPEGDIMKLSVPNIEDSRVDKILVQEGDRVRKNQVIAVLHGVERLKQDLSEAQNAVSYHEAKLRRIEIEEEENDRQVQETKVALSQAGYDQAKFTYNRYQNLIGLGAIAHQTFDESQRALDVAAALLDREKQNLFRLAQTRKAEIEMAKIELKEAAIVVKQRKADLENTQVRAPIAGQILRIDSRIGEQVDADRGIVELGRTDWMYAIAEVNETDISKVQIGQTATINSEYGGFDGELQGKVEHLGLKIEAKKISNISQGTIQDKNSSIVKVKIRLNLEDSKKVAGLTHSKVRVQIGK